KLPIMSKAAQAKKRGLSLEEKRERMLEIFYESKDFFLLKELERMGSKRGVISQAVKDVIQTLVDDDLVLRDKIGTSVYFWSLPSSAGNKLRQAEAQLTAEVGELQAKKARLEARLQSAQAGRQQSEERSKALGELAVLQAKNRKLKEELAEFAENDPELLEHKSTERDPPTHVSHGPSHPCQRTSSPCSSGATTSSHKRLRSSPSCMKRLD
ncbi:unnamed protein product, partial [Closterium sp. NIES-53]